jgi:hypothetical protein
LYAVRIPAHDFQCLNGRATRPRDPGKQQDA